MSVNLDSAMVLESGCLASLLLVARETQPETPGCGLRRHLSIASNASYHRQSWMNVNERLAEIWVLTLHRYLPTIISTVCLG